MNYTVSTNEDFSVTTKASGNFVVPAIESKILDTAFPITYTYNDQLCSIEQADYSSSMLSGNATQGWTLMHDGHRVCLFQPNTGISRNVSEALDLRFNGAISTALDFIKIGATLDDISGAVENINGKLSALLEDETISSFYYTVSSDLDETTISSTVLALYKVIDKLVSL